MAASASATGTTAAVPRQFTAARYAKYGHPKDVITLDQVDTPTTVPPGFLLVRIHAAATNPVDYKILRGFTGEWAKAHFPETPCLDLAGEVVAVPSGDEEVSRAFPVGTRIAANIGVERNRPTFAEYLTLPQGPYGSMAEYALILARTATKIQDKLDYVSAASVPLAGVTSFQALVHHCNMVTDGSKTQKILILGGAGGTGSLAVQIAKAYGHYVATTASARNVEFVKALGADEVIDYGSENWWEKLAGQEYDIGYNSVSAEDRLSERGYKVLRKGGHWVTIVGAVGADEKEGYHSANFVLDTTVGEVASGLKTVFDLVHDGRVKPQVDRVFHGLGEVAAALEYQGQGKARGKIVVEIKA